MARLQGPATMDSGVVLGQSVEVYNCFERQCQNNVVLIKVGQTTSDLEEKRGEREWEKIEWNSWGRGGGQQQLRKTEKRGKLF